MNDVPLDTEDNDSILDNCFLENRHAFLSFCQGNHYQFDSLRRAKHSSMMILYHLQNPNGSNDGTVCRLCFKDTGVDHKWTCEICPEFSVCSLCYQRNDASCHNHMLVQHLPTAIRGTESKMTEMVRIAHMYYFLLRMRWKLVYLICLKLYVMMIKTMAIYFC